jgi:membrane fusion protein, adhesin transport system
LNQIDPAFRVQTYSLAPERPPRSWAIVVILICAVLAAAVAWSSMAEVDELSRAQGKVIPWGKTQTIQSAEPGVIEEILIRDGEHVKASQLLIKLDDTYTSSSQGEIEAKVLALRTQVARLRAESEGKTSDFACPEDVSSVAPSICANEALLQRARAQNFEQSLQVLASRVEQRQRELNQAEADRIRFEQTVALAQQKLDLLKPMFDKKLVSQTEYIGAQQSLADGQGQLGAVREVIERSKAALSEAMLQAQQAELQFRQDALTDLTGKLAELASSEQTLRGASDRVTRTEIRSPVDGIVNSLAVNTLGGFVNAGEKLLEIVPVQERLLIEARLAPSDVAFVLPGQEAHIKFTAYDFSIFGGLKGRVRTVSADSIVDPNTREAYFVVLIETDSSTLSYRDRELPITPGMIASVEILTGHKTVLQYLLKPINKAKDEAFHER